MPLATGEIPGIGVDRVLQRHHPQRRQPSVTRQFVSHPLPHQVVAWVLSQQCDPTRGLDLAPDRIDQPGGGLQQRALAGPVAAHQGNSFAAVDPQVQAAQDVVWLVGAGELDPEGSCVERGGCRGPGPLLTQLARVESGRLAVGGLPEKYKPFGGGQAPGIARLQGGKGLAGWANPRWEGVDAGEGEEAGGWGGEGGVGGGGPSGEVRWGGVEG